MILSVTGIGILFVPVVNLGTPPPSNSLEYIITLMLMLQRNILDVIFRSFADADSTKMDYSRNPLPGRVMDLLHHWCRYLRKCWSLDLQDQEHALIVKG